jgi:hypothetical protein
MPSPPDSASPQDRQQVEDALTRARRRNAIFWLYWPPLLAVTGGVGLVVMLAVPSLRDPTWASGCFGMATGGLAGQFWKRAGNGNGR